MKHYTFVDYATQIYSGIVALVILLFHNQTVRFWPVQFTAHVLVIILVHQLVRLNARSSNKPLDLLRHFYPVGLYIWFFSETGWLNRMFFSSYLDPAVVRFEGQLFGCQPSILLMQIMPFKV